MAALGVVAVIVLLIGLALVGYASVARTLPLPDELQARVSQFASTLIYDREGGLLNEVADPDFGRRTTVALDQISPYLKDATIATEDPNFYRHGGVDPIGLARALYYAIRERDLNGPGGSTITQQLVKLTFLSAERTLSRKLKEAILATEISRRYPKDTILQIYLNELNYGNLAYGIEAAAETYFDKRAADLTLAEATLLAGLPQAPAYYDPYTRLWEADGSPGAVKRRQGEVLRLMVEHGAITPAQADAAWQEPIRLKPLGQTYSSKSPHFVQYARGEVERVVGPELMAKGGLRIYTTLDLRIQAIAEEEVAQQLADLASQGATNSAVVAVRPGTGELLTLVGSADFYSEAISGQIDMTLSPRQPGSAIKPFTYLAAFEMPAAVSQAQAEAVSAAALQEGASDVYSVEPPGYWTPATVLMDVRTEFPDGANPPYVPYNYGGSATDVKEHGLVTVRKALGNSYNIPAVKTLEHAGIERLKDVARRVGITTLTRPDYGLSLTLGGGDVTLLELTGAYATLANGGTRVPISAIACVLDDAGRLIWRGTAADAVQGCTAAGTAPAAAVITPQPPQSAVNPQYAYLITSILANPEARQPTFSAGLLSLPDRPVAAKTGTTNDYRDAWTLGYTPDLAVGVWVGNADYTPMQAIAGARGAAPIWRNVMARSLAGQPARPFVEPAGIQHLRICTDSGTTPSVACPPDRQREALFAAGQGPLPAGFDLWQRVVVDRVTGQLATEFTPADRLETRDVTIPPAKYRAWFEAHGYPVLAVEPPNYAFQPELMLYSPTGGEQLTGVAPVFGRAHVPEPLLWRLEYGVGPNPIGWGLVAGPSADDVNGHLGDWDTGILFERHGVDDYSLRLAAYDPANIDYPVAVSNVVYVRVALPTPTPTASPTASPTPSATASPTPTASATPETPTPSVTPTVMPAETPGTPVSPTAPPPTAPPPTALPTATPIPTVYLSPTPVPTVPVPGPVRSVIVSPSDGSVVSGSVQVLGIADGPGFARYELSYAAGDTPQADAWQPVAPPPPAPVSGGLLGVWQTGALSPGVYSLRLRVFEVSEAFQDALVRVTVQ
ncbi:MAG: hypothetical protein AUK03_12045 [Anaerolineae bacterium CG2_30_64_16]|nr:MAG: hypothetical protein AUK03_12045 [Anaerolineae bacterium CG2_30_64_16]